MGFWIVLMLGVVSLIVSLYVGIKIKARHAQREQPIAQSLPIISPRQRIMSCPSCSQRMMFMVPLKGNRAQCRKCSSRFKLDIDEHGNVYITELQKPEDKDIHSLEECFQILELRPEALPIDIRSAYKRKIMEYHPDKVESLGAKIKQVAELETRRINAAYAKLEEEGKV